MATFGRYSNVQVLRELAMMSAAVAAYFGVRALTRTSHDRAFGNAARLVDLERSLGVRQESIIQSLVLPHHWLVDLVNWIYIWGHWPLIASIGIWLIVRRPDLYRRYRQAFFLSGAIGLAVFIAFPVAPPRLASPGVVDTVSLYSHSYRVLQPPSLEDIYASLPSLHVGWDLLIGLALVDAARSRALKLLGYVLPAAMAFAVVATANHYVIDVAAGISIAFVSRWAAGTSTSRLLWLDP
jgi:hypothetical protein